MIALLLFACASSSNCDSAVDDVKIVDWHTSTPGTGGDLYGTSLVGGDGFVVGAGGAAAFTTDGGEAWVAGTIGAVDLFDVARSDDQPGIAVGAGGTIREATADGDFAWGTIDGGTTADLFAIDLSGQNGAIAGDGVLLRSTDAGASWDATELPGTFRAITLANAIPWAVGDDGIAAHWDGDSWETSTLTAADLSSIAFLDADNGVAAGSGEVWITTDAGASWTAVESAPTEAITSLTVGGGALLGTGAAGAILRSQNGGETWLAIHQSGIAGLRSITVYDDNTMPNTQIAVAAPDDQVLVYGSRFETSDATDDWDCE